MLIWTNILFQREGSMPDIPDRALLEKVPRIHFYEGGPGCPEDIPFPSVMRALMEFLGEAAYGCRSRRALKPCFRIKCGYSFFVGVSGVASFLNWGPGWEEDNVEIMYMSDNPGAPFMHVFEAIGYNFSYSGEGGSEESFRETITQSIRSGFPVLAFNLVGPPESSLVTGYDEGGKVLIGWSFFQKIPDFSGGAITAIPGHGGNSPIRPYAASWRRLYSKHAERMGRRSCISSARFESFGLDLVRCA
jgi:hypothetical protein